MEKVGLNSLSVERHINGNSRKVRLDIIQQELFTHVGFSCSVSKMNIVDRRYYEKQNIRFSFYHFDTLEL